MEPGTLPRDRDTERSLLGTILRYPEHADQALALLRSELAFYSPLHRSIFKAIRSVRQRDQAPDPVVVLAELKESNTTIEGEPITAADLGDLEQAVGSPKYVGTYAEIVRGLWFRRQAIEAAHQITECSTTMNAVELAQLFRLAASAMEEDRIALEVLDLASAVKGDIPEVPWIIEGWIAAGDRTVLAGEWATGKSLIALDLAIAVSSGQPWMQKFPVSKVGPVVYVDEENNRINSSRRFGRLARGRQMTPAQAEALPIRYLPSNRIRLDSQRSLSALRATLDATRPILLVFDSLVRFYSIDENKSVHIARLYDEAIKPLADDYGCAVLCLDHMSKPNKESQNEDSGHRIRGSGDKAGAPDVVLTLEGSRETDRRTLSCRKNRWEDSLPPPVTTRWCVSDDGEAAWIEASDANLDASQAIKHALTNSPDGLYATDLYEKCAHLGVVRITAIRSVKRLIRQGSVSFEKQGRRILYRIAPAPKLGIEPED